MSGDDNNTSLLLDRFTDPVKKKKRKRRKEAAEAVKRQRIVEDGKRYARDCFNDPPSSEDRELWGRFYAPPPTEYVPAPLEYETITNHGEMSCVFDFILAAGHCAEWLRGELAAIGWKKNVTGYSPVAVSHSTNELLSATRECRDMALKQASWLSAGAEARKE
jgi:hypothetical protein